MAIALATIIAFPASLPAWSSDDARVLHSAILATSGGDRAAAMALAQQRGWQGELAALQAGQTANAIRLLETRQLLGVLQSLDAGELRLAESYLRRFTFTDPLLMAARDDRAGLRIWLTERGHHEALNLMATEELAPVARWMRGSDLSEAARFAASGDRERLAGYLRARAGWLVMDQAEAIAPAELRGHLRLLRLDEALPLLEDGNLPALRSWVVRNRLTQSLAQTELRKVPVLNRLGKQDVDMLMNFLASGDEEQLKRDALNRASQIVQQEVLGLVFDQLRDVLPALPLSDLRSVMVGWASLVGALGPLSPELWTLHEDLRHGIRLADYLVRLEDKLRLAKLDYTANPTTEARAELLTMLSIQQSHEIALRRLASAIAGSSAAAASFTEVAKADRSTLIKASVLADIALRAARRSQAVTTSPADELPSLALLAARMEPRSAAAPTPDPANASMDDLLSHTMARAEGRARRLGKTDSLNLASSESAKQQVQLAAEMRDNKGNMNLGDTARQNAEYYDKHWINNSGANNTGSDGGAYLGWGITPGPGGDFEVCDVIMNGPDGVWRKHFAMSAAAVENNLNASRAITPDECAGEVKKLNCYPASQATRGEPMIIATPPSCPKP